MSHPPRAWLLIGLSGALCAAVAARAAEDSSSDTSSSSQPTRSRLTPLAEQFLEEAKVRLEAQRREQAARAQTRQREEAQKLAIQVAREKLKQQTINEHEAQRQMAATRERQLKSLYAEGLARYQHGAYDEAVALLQQLQLAAPEHPLAKAAERLISQAELKTFEQRLRASVEPPKSQGGAIVPDLERRLTGKRMELETVLKYARLELQQRKYDAALKLVTGVLVQDPENRPAQQLLEAVQLAKLNDARARDTRTMEQDERAMINDVIKAQVLPPPPTPPPVALPKLIAQDSGAVLRAKLAQPISFDFNDVALSDVLDFVGDAANVSIIPSPKLDLKKRRVTLKATQMPLELAIKYLAKSLSLAYRVEDDAVVIATAEEFSKAPMQTRVFFLRSGLTPFALEASAVEPNPALSVASITDLLQHSVPKAAGSKFVVDERSGAIIVTDTAEHLGLIEQLLSRLDTTPIQILIEARFIELTMADLAHTGFEEVLTGNQTLLEKTAANGTRGAAHQIASGGGVKFPALSRESEALNFTLQGVLTGTQFEAALHLLEETKKSKTLSAPRVTTLNNQSALIRVVDEFNYPTRYEVSLIQFDINGDGDFNDAGETEFANVPQDFQKRNIGIQLNVTPSVGADMRTITLVLAPEVSSFSSFKDLGGGVSVPTFTSSQLTTSIAIENGQTVVLGGLMKDSASKTVSKLPLLGDLPLIGGLFRQTEDSISRKNLLIFITAHILAPRGHTT